MSDGHVKDERDCVERRDAVLAAITNATEVFLRGSLSTWQDNVLQVIERLGSEVGASRIYLCKNSEVTAEVAVTGVRYQWRRRGSATEVDVPQLQEINLQESGFSRWPGILYHGGIISGWIADLPLSERGWFMAEEAETLIVVPVFVEEEWWGFIGIEDYGNRAEFSQAELDAFKTLGVIFGAAIRRKRIEEALEREKASVMQKAREIEDVAKFPAEDPSPILRVSKRGVVLYGNEAAEEVLEHWQVKAGDRLPEKWIELTREILKQSKGRAIDLQIGEVIFELLIVPVGGDYLNIYGRDVTKERQADQTKTQFISMASHQLRTPLTSLRWYTERLLKNHENLTEKQQEAVEVIHESTMHMAKLVDDLLNLSRIESGKLKPEKVEMDLAQIVRENYTELAAQAEEKQVQLEMKFEGEFKINNDPDLVKQVHINLLSNAIKYTPSGGKVVTEIEKGDDKVMVKIRDNGIGIPEKEVDKIFERFYRASNASELVEQGTGLGLSVAQMMVEQCGGEIGYEGNLSPGSVFYFSLPIL